MILTRVILGELLGRKFDYSGFRENREMLGEKWVVVVWEWGLREGLGVFSI